jgi:hypothetical protein
VNDDINRAETKIDNDECSEEEYSIGRDKFLIFKNYI